MMIASMTASAPLADEYRPRTWDEVIGQQKALKTLETLSRRGLGGRFYWISGPSGTGKTTIANLLARELADDLYIEEIDASRLTVARIGEIEQAASMFAWGRGGRVWIVNEAHGLRKDAIRRLLTLRENGRWPTTATLVFTTTCDGQESLFDEAIDAHPLLSRCTVLSLARQGLGKPFAARALAIAQEAGLDGGRDEKYALRRVQQHRNNLRAVLQEIEQGDWLNQ